jgi:hypothetical protein
LRKEEKTSREVEHKQLGTPPWQQQTHTAYIVQKLLAKIKMAVLPHPPYSPNLAQSDFFLFPKMRTKSKRQRFDTIEEIQAETQMVINTLTKKHF